MIELIINSPHFATCYSWRATPWWSNDFLSLNKWCPTRLQTQIASKRRNLWSFWQIACHKDEVKNNKIRSLHGQLNQERKVHTNLHGCLVPRGRIPFCTGGWWAGEVRVGVGVHLRADVIIKFGSNFTSKFAQKENRTRKLEKWKRKMKFEFSLGYI